MKSCPLEQPWAWAQPPIKISLTLALELTVSRSIVLCTDFAAIATLSEEWHFRQTRVILHSRYFLGFPVGFFDIFVALDSLGSPTLSFPGQKS